MRVTRARAQQSVEEPTTNEQERSPLVEILPNASPEQVATVEEGPKKALTRSKSKKGAKKGAKGKKNNVVEDEPAQVITEDERQAAASPAGEAAVEDLAKDADEMPPVSVIDERPASPPSKAVRLTRRQLAKQEEELKQAQLAQSSIEQPEPAMEEIEQPEPAVEKIEQSQPADVQEETNTTDAVQDEATKVTEDELVEIAETVEEAAVPHEDVEPAPQDNEAAQEDVETIQEAKDLEVVEPVVPVELEAQAVDVARDVNIPSVERMPSPEPKSLVVERPTEDTLSPAASRTPSRRRVSRSPSKSPMRIEESIEALDALEEALEDVGKAVSHFDQSHDEKSPRKKTFPVDAATPNTRSKTSGRTPLYQRISKAPSAAPSSIKPTKSTIARASSLRTAVGKDVARKGSAEAGDYLASKRRPISVSFPTPPPPPKGRAPTKPAFQLSSETVAAKLKAQKEERLKREAEREAQPSIAPKQRPVSVSLAPMAKSSKPPTKASFQLPGEAVAAKLKAQREERQKREAEGTQGEQAKPKARPISMPPAAVRSTKPPTKASFQLPGSAVAAKLKAQREERQKRAAEAEEAKKAAAVTAPKSTTLANRKSIVLPSRAQPGITIPPPSKPESSSSESNKRNSIQLSRSTSVSTAASSCNRNSIIGVKSVVTPVDAVQQKMKGREVFLRDRMEKDIREKERREKEEAAKKARAEAAERGRIASREWAERQRKKMMDAVKAKASGA